MVASCRATAPLGDPAAEAAAVTAGSSSLEKLSMCSMASRPMPIRELASAVAMAVTARAPTRATPFTGPWPAPMPSAREQKSTTASSKAPLRKALRITPPSSALPVSRI